MSLLRQLTREFKGVVDDTNPERHDSANSRSDSLSNLLADPFSNMTNSCPEIVFIEESELREFRQVW